MPLPLYLLGAFLALVPPSMAADPAAKGSAGGKSRPEQVDERPKSDLERQVVDEQDPYAAENFLKDAELQERLKREDQDLYNRLFLCATQSRDMLGVLATYKDPDDLRLALSTRKGMRLADSPQALLEWAKKNADYVDSRRIEQAVWGWDTLSDGQRQWLAGRKLTPETWGKTSFPVRQKLLSQWGAGLYDQVMKASPKTPEDVKRMRDLELQAWGALDHDQRVNISERVEKARAAVKSLADAEQRLSGLKDPKLQQLLAQARTSASLEDTLSRLGGIFDGLGVSNAALSAARPSGDRQSFTEKDRGVVTDMLKTGFEREIGGTTAGDLLLAFYKDPRHPMNVTLDKMDSRLAEYRGETQTIAFNQEHVERYLRTYVVERAPEDVVDASGKVTRKKGDPVKVGITVAELKKNPEALNGLVWELASTFVHEGTHHRQDLWARERGLPDDWYDQGQEIETMSMEGLFILQKSQRTPAYRSFLEGRQDISDLAKESISLADSLQRDPAQFRNDIRQGYYPGLHSVESQAWELSRKRRGDARTQVPGFYRMFRERYEGVDNLVEDELTRLEESPAPEAASSRVNGTLPVPVPKKK